MKEGRKEGRTEGRKKGRTEGRKKGRTEGRKKEQKEERKNRRKGICWVTIVMEEREGKKGRVEIVVSFFHSDDFSYAASFSQV